MVVSNSIGFCQQNAGEERLGAVFFKPGSVVAALQLSVTTQNQIAQLAVNTVEIAPETAYP